MKSIFASRAHRYEKRLSYPIVSAYMKNRDRHIGNFLSKGNGNLLDLGCGTGYYLKGFLRKFSSVIAVDSSKEMLEIFLENNREKEVHLVRADARRFSAKEKFSRIICIGLLNYISYNEAEKLIGKLYRLLKDGGSILLTAPSSNRVSGHAYSLVWATRGVKINLYSKKFLLEKMRAAGFKKIKIKNAKDFPTFHIILEASK